jgi:hypothetical protein
MYAVSAICQGFCRFCRICRFCRPHPQPPAPPPLPSSPAQRGFSFPTFGRDRKERGLGGEVLIPGCLPRRSPSRWSTLGFAPASSRFGGAGKQVISVAKAGRRPNHYTRRTRRGDGTPRRGFVLAGALWRSLERLRCARGRFNQTRVGINPGGAGAGCVGMEEMEGGRDAYV